MNYDVLHNFISPVTGRVPLIKDYILIGGSDNFSIMSPKLIDMQLDIIDIRHDFDTLAASSFIVGFPNEQLPNSQVLNSLADGFMFNTSGIVSTTNNIPLPSLTYNKIWVGDAQNKPVETDLNFAPNDASYILKTPKIGLNNAQALSELIGGILKSAPITGTLSSAIGGVDYATEESVVAAQAAADAAAVEAAAAPAAGAALAALYFAEQMLPYLPSPIPFTGPGTQISGLIGAASAAAASASSAASSAQTTANTAITRIDNLNVTLQGDIIGSGNLSNPIVTLFTANPSFTGKEYIKIPVGNIAERPSNSQVGMVRYNTEI
jgi:hypothetical protein